MKTRSIHSYLTAILILLPPGCLWAETPLTLKDCFKASLNRSEVLATQQELVLQTEETYHRAWGAILPSVNGSYSYFHQNGSGFSSSGNTATSAGQQTLEVTADQPLFRGFRNFAAVNAAKASITAQELAKEWAGMQLYSDVATAFYTRLAVQRDLNVLDNELELYGRRIKELQDRIVIGRSRITEVLTAQSAQAILKAQREQVLGQLEVAKEVLAFLTGLDEAVQLDDTDAFPVKIASLESYQSQIDARPDIMAARKNVEASESNISVAKGAYLPSADLIGDYYLERPDLKQNGAWDVEIAVTLPIFEGGINRSNVKTAESQKRQNEMQLSQVQRMALQGIRSLHHSLMADMAQLAALQEAFAISEENYKANVKDYERNLVSNLDVLQALAAYQDTERSLEKIRYLTKTDFNQLEAAVAHRLSLMKSLKKR